MQNKGAIRLFAILLTIACAYYLMFTYVANGITKDSETFASDYISQPKVIADATKATKTEPEKNTYLDSVKNYKKNDYLESLKKKVVYNLFITSYTYDDVKKRQLNLGLDLKGGMNVTLEISVADIIRQLSNNSNDPAFNQALVKANERQKTDPRDYVTLFGEEFHKLSSNAKLAINFQTIELKGKIDFNTSDEDVLKFIRDRVEDAISTSENTLRARIDKFGVTQPSIQRLASSGRILIELPGVSDKNRVRKLLQGTANLEFWETYDNKDIYPLLEKANKRLKEILTPNDTLVKKPDTAVVAKVDNKKTIKVKKKGEKDNLAKTDTTKVKGDTSKTLAKQLGLGKTDTTLKAKSTRQDTINKFKKENPLFAVLSPSTSGKNQELGQGPVIGLSIASTFNNDTALVNKYLSMPQIRALFPPIKFYWSFKPAFNDTIFNLIAIKLSNREGKSPLSGDIITEARVVYDQQSGGTPSISMNMTSDASLVWKHLTHDNVGKSIAVVLDNSVYSYPNVQGEIPNGSSSITGNFSQEEAKDLVNILKAGKLPARANIVQEVVVGATLGQEAVTKGLRSIIYALILVLLFMGLYYSKAGWVADFAMVINNFFVIGILASFSAVLTLPGIAGIVLTIAMSVDANILIFERVREELAMGKATALAIKEGYRNAMSSVIDSHVTGLLLGIILYVFGTGPIQGFATTLIIGIVSSLFCAIFITRLIFERWLGKGKAISFDNKYTAGAFKKININFVGKRKLYYLFSSLIIVAGIIAYVAKGGFTLGVDFKGGRSYVVRFDEAASVEDCRKALAVTFGSEPEVKTYGENTQVRITTTYLIGETGDDVEKKVEDKLDQGLKTLKTHYTVMSSQKVGETVSRDIKTKAIWAVLLSCLVMFMFIFIRFKKWQYGLGAVVALFHDVLIVLSVFVIFDGVLPFSLEITQDFIAAILTVMSYSMTDTVVVFDRIREYLTEKNKSDLHKNERVEVINYALNSTLSRTINTSLTIFFVLLSIFIFGGETIRGFSFALLIGIVIGTYSSICIATPIVIDFEKDKEDVEKPGGEVI